MDMDEDVSEFLRYSLVIVLLLCLLLSNSIYTLFQIYHNSRPPVQNNVINKLYVLLSIEYQLINISSVILLIVKFGFPSLGDDLANKIPLACICIFMAARGVLTGLLFSTLAVISLLRYLKEFHFKHFQIWPQATLLRISSFFCILPTVLTQMAIAIRCRGKEICNMELVDNIFNRFFLCMFSLSTIKLNHRTVPQIHHKKFPLLPKIHQRKRTWQL